MSFLNFASNPFFEDSDITYSAAAKSRLKYEETGKDRYHMCLDFIETPTQFVVICDAPGIPKDRIKVQVKENRIFIEGKRKKKIVSDSDEYLICERLNGPFRRVISVPTECDANQMVAKLEDGLLVLTMPKVEVKKDAVSIAVQWSVWLKTDPTFLH